MSPTANSFTGRAVISAAEISRMLAERVDQLARDLLPDGHREGAEWRCGSLAGEPGHSLGVHLGAGPKRGVWGDFATGDGGDLLDLVRAVHRLDMAAAIDWSRRWLGFADGGRRPPSIATSRPAPDRERAAVDHQPRALDIWRSARESIAATPAAAYLRGRGLDPVKLYSLHGHGQWPATLRKLKLSLGPIAGHAARVDATAALAWVRQREAARLPLTRSDESLAGERARARNAEAQAELRELELAQLRGETVLVSEVLPIVRDELAMVRSRLLAMPARLAGALTGMTDRRRVEAAIMAEWVDRIGPKH